MDAADVLADLTAVSAEIEVAVALDGSGAVLTASGADPERAERLAAAATTFLVAADAAAPGRRATQVEAGFRDGSVFAVRDGAFAIVAATCSRPTSALVLYDLRSALRKLGEETAPRPKRRPRRKKADAAP